MNRYQASASQCPLKGHQWIVFGPDWGRHPSVSQHVFSQFINSSQIVWVETVGLRSPAWSLRDWFRSCQKLADFLTGRRAKAARAEGFTILSPITLPVTRWRWVRRFNLRQVRRGVSAAVRRLGFDRYKLVVTVPSQCDYVGRLGEALSLYYCIDNYALWSGMNADHVQRLEAEMIERVDGVIVASEALRKRFVPYGKRVHVLTHGVDLNHFQICRERPPADRLELVYFGLIDERIDDELLVKLAKALPEASIRLIGPVTADTSRLTAEPNILLEGPVHYRDLPRAVASAHLFLLPFRENELSRSCSPIKLKEYLACGRPVVATSLPETEKMARWICVASDADAFVRSARQLVREAMPTAPDAALLSFLAGQTWHVKAVELAILANSWTS